MEKLCKEFKSLSLFLGFMAVLQVLEMVSHFTTVTEADIIAALSSVDLNSLGITVESMIPVMRVLSAVPFVLTILVHIFLCIKGCKEANDPSGAKAHVILAAIWVIFYALSTIGSIGMMFSGEGDMVLYVLDVVLAAGSAALMFYYSKIGRQIRVMAE